MKNQAFKDGQSFYIPSPGCDKRIAWQMLESEINNAFTPPEELKAAYKKLPDNLINEVIEYYGNYKRGILDTIKKYPSIVPPKVKKILAKYWIS